MFAWRQGHERRGVMRASRRLAASCKELCGLRRANDAKKMTSLCSKGREQA